MIHEMYSRREDQINHPVTLITFEEFVILYLNYKPRLKLKFGEIRQAFDEMVKSGSEIDQEREMLTRETFIDMIENIGQVVKIIPIFHG